jgi:hypothetical protein
MSTITLPRTGLRSFSFEGELLADADSQRTSGPCESRWWELALYSTADKRYVIAVGYRTQWQGEHETDKAVVLDTPGEVEKWLLDHPFLDGIRGYPPGQEDRQERLEQSLRQCWEAAVTEVLAVLGPEELT